MNIKTKKFLALSVLGLFVFTFALSFVAAANPVGDWFSGLGWGSPEFSSSVARVLFTILIGVVVWSVMNQIPGLDSLSNKAGGAPGVLFSAIIAFLSMAYITPDEVYALMTSYTALGYVIGGGLPIMILTFFTISMATKGGGATSRVSRKMLAFLLWLGFVMFSLYKALSMPDTSTVNWLAVWFFPIAGICMMLATNAIFLWAAGEVVKEKINVYKEARKKRTQAIKGDVEEVEEVSKG